MARFIYVHMHLQAEKAAHMGKLEKLVQGLSEQIDRLASRPDATASKTDAQIQVCYAC